MISVLSQSPLLPLSDHQPGLQLNELGTLGSAVEAFTKMLSRSGQTAVRLHCTLPTWSPSYDTYLDLHDINELRSRVLLFIHDLLQSLRSADIVASYSLAPSNLPVCLVWALPPDPTTVQVKIDGDDLLKGVQIRKRDNVLVADLKGASCLIIT
ncbi:hypothetical protein AMATHDRAFT_52075 [Amanita thiersii Skay4041]|uniref:Uncharacterized protein n=1 Tax=Amanita thiersii Skay4041 TaxID=703135 RepID=A0A2A9NY42_9AGAR|nr:hypothetical protein AMATHDRAFT_52075 [Amanita thiersii Skay4041]